MEETYTEPAVQTPEDPAQVYLEAATLAQGLTAQELKQAVALFERIPGYLDAAQRVEVVRKQYIELLHKEQAELQAQKVAKLKQYLIFGGAFAGAAALLIAIIVLVVSAIQKHNTYSDALQLMSQENYVDAITRLESLEDYKDAPELLSHALYLREQQLLDQDYDAAMQLVENKEYQAAIDAFEALDDHRDSREQLANAQELLRLQQEEEARAETYRKIQELLASNDDAQENEAHALLCSLGDYKDAPQLLEKFRQVATQTSFVAGASTSYCDSEEISTFNDRGLVELTTRETELSYNKTYATKITYTYDDAGRELTTAYEYLNILSSQMGGKNPVKTQSTYDSEGRLIDYCTTYLDGSIGHEYTRWYDQEENLLSTELSDEYLASQADGTLTFTLTNKVLDEAGNVLRTWKEVVNADGTCSGERTDETTYEFDENGRVSRSSTLSALTGTYSTTVYTYDQDGKLTYLDQGSSYNSYTYDQDGNLSSLIYGQYSSKRYTIHYTYSWIYAPNA